MKRKSGTGGGRGSSSYDNQQPPPWLYIAIFFGMLCLTAFLYSVSGQPMSAHLNTKFENAILDPSFRAKLRVPTLSVLTQPPQEQQQQQQEQQQQGGGGSAEKEIEGSNNNNNNDDSSSPAVVALSESDRETLENKAKELRDVLQGSKWHKKEQRRKQRLMNDDDEPEVRGRQGKVKHHKSIHEEVQPRVRGRPEGSDDPADIPHPRRKHKKRAAIRRDEEEVEK
eukprot:PhF_6_TR18932/c2_g1_i3/m.27722